MKNQDRILLAKISFVFMIITTILIGWLIIPLFWMIPMTVVNNRIIKQLEKGEEKSFIVFSICTLIFANVISGILLLLAEVLNDENEVKEKESVKDKQ
ncbi:hypothetical protein [Mesoplasma corruscae]|uniref:Uncharacterized protein n=1 Tax=Mesoplasma corruscae TaxID=216874 RepID=A0A2S5RHM6_9MOLU|nr:hypothetical protein [Mesoplasma corruscae]PPE06813.1 hypothetical protein MCORR_v1c04440 [Mesoplasma corruscae]